MKKTYRIPFNKPHMTGREVHYIYDAVYSGHISGNGKYTKLCHEFFKKRYGFKHCLLTTSGTDALEMCGLLACLTPGDEVIVPSYTFVSTANAFVLRGAHIVFADSMAEHPNIDPAHVASLITPRTKCIVVVHYGGVSCKMDEIMSIAQKHGIMVIEDAAHSIDSYFVKDGVRYPLGSIGHMSAFSFHETKNIICGEGGMLVVNEPSLVPRSEIIWEKGTNRAAFFRGEARKYEWVDVGSSFLLSEILSAFLYAQLEELDKIQQRRLYIWNTYYDGLKYLEDRGYVRLPVIPHYATNNAHVFYLVCHSRKDRDALIEHLGNHGILAVHHYLPLHLSPFYCRKHMGGELPNAVRFSECLVRLPLFYDLDDADLHFVIDKVVEFFRGRSGG